MKNLKSWKTTLFGIIALVPAILSVLGVHLTPELNGIIISIAGGGVGFTAKDSNVTGGTKAATPEAETRVVVKPNETN